MDPGVGWGWSEIESDSSEASRADGSLQRSTVSAYFPNDHDIPATVDVLVSAMNLPAGIQCVSHGTIPRQHFQPSVIVVSFTT